MKWESKMQSLKKHYCWDKKVAPGVSSDLKSLNMQPSSLLGCIHQLRRYSIIKVTRMGSIIPKEIKKKDIICTIVKDGEPFFGRFTPLNTSFTEEK